jgi:hypothetical protein
MALLIGAGLALSACGGQGAGDEAQVLVGKGDGPAFESRQPGSRRPGAQAAGEFEFVRYAIDVSSDQPRACLTFSSSLDPARDYEPFLTVSTEEKIAVAVDGANLCIGGLTFGEEREITLKAGLTALDGRTLAYDESLSIEFGDRPSYVGFKGDGVILPRIEADGLAIEAVNVDKVRVTISRITDRALAFKTITSGYAAAQGDYGWMEYGSDPGDVAERIWSGSIETPGSPNAARTVVFPIAKAVPRLQAGAYFVELDQLDAAGKVPDSAAQAKRWLIITDLALTTYTGSRGVSTTVRSIQSAKPVRGVKLELVARNNDILARGESDLTGKVTFSGPALKGEGPASPRMIMAYAPNGDFAILDLDRSPIDLSESNIGGRDPAKLVDAYVYFDRGVYRPGETVHAQTLLRSASARAISDRAGAIVIYGPNGLEAERHRFEAAKQAGGLSYDFSLPRSAARGEWRMVAEVDGIGAVGGASFSVEDFVPQRISLTLKSDAERAVGRNETRSIEADVRFLYGAPGAGLPVEASTRIEPDESPFPNLKDFRFGRHSESFREIAFDANPTVADGSGKAVVIVDPRPEEVDSSRPLRLRTVVSAIEPGGRAVRDDVRTPYRPNERYLGVRPTFADEASPEGQPAGFEIASVDAQGGLKSGEINWRLVRIDWKYDWYRADGGAWQWRRSREIVNVEEGVLRLADAKTGSLKTRNLDWGDYELMLTESTHGAEASMGFWVGWGGQPQDGVEAPDRVRLSVPETLPAPGGEVEVGLMSPYAGEAEIVVASEDVILSRTISVKAGGSRIRLPVTREWGAGAYVMASVYTPRDPASRPRPRRAVGVAHIGVDMTARTYDLKLTAPDVQRPLAPMTVKIEAAGGPGTGETWVRIAAVDEGILLLTRFRSPDPVEYFFGKRRLGVELRDDYARLLDPNQGVAAAARSGGDQIGGAGLSVVPTRSVALVSRTVKLDRRGRADITLDIPEFNGRLRLMAVAWSADGLGASAREVTVRDATPAELILPRFLAPGDQALATLTLDNVEGAAGAYEARVTTQGPVTSGTESLSARLAKGQRQDLPVSLSAGSEGVSRLALKVSGPGGAATGRGYDIQSRSAFLPVSRVDRRMLQPGETYTPRSDALRGFVSGSSGLQVSFSPIPMDAAALYESLERYPYGCTEQIVSRAMPLLYAGQIAQLAGRKAPGDLRNQVQEAVSTLLNRQGSDGAIGLWRIGDRAATPWIGAYAVDFLSRAKAAGYVVPDAALDSAYDALEEFTVRESSWSTGYAFDVSEGYNGPETSERLMDRAIAYGAYVLAKAGRIDASRLRYLHDDRIRRIPDPLSRAHIASALYMVGDKARSKSAFDQAERAIGFQNDGDIYQSPRRDLAGLLALAGEMRSSDRIERLVSRVTRDLPEPDRLTTQEKAFLLLAANALSGGESAVTVGVEGEAPAVTAGRVYRLGESIASGSPTFTNKGQGPLWVTAIARGSPASAPPADADGLTALKQLWSPSGRALDGASFTQGERIIVAISVSSSEERRTPLILADLLPAGFEIEAVLRPADAGASGPYGFLGDLAYPDIAEARDDRFIASLDLYDRQPAKVAYIVRAATPGRFTLPGVVAEDMYRPDTFARTAARTITVARRN